MFTAGFYNPYFGSQMPSDTGLMAKNLFMPYWFWGIVVAGGLQVASQWFALWRLGFLPLVDFASSWQPLKSAQ